MTITENGHKPDELVIPQAKIPDWMNATAIAIVGHRGTGKTALACHLLDEVDGRKPVWVYQHPKPELIDSRGWHNMYRLETLYDLDNVVVWLDEPQLSIQKLDKRSNDGLQRLLSIARHRDLTLVLSTCDTRWITRALESYIDRWLVKDIDITLAKQGSTLKRIYQKYAVCDPTEVRLKRSEYLDYSWESSGPIEKRTFSPPSWFDDSWSKPYSLKHENGAETATDVATEPRQVTG